MQVSNLLQGIIFDVYKRYLNQIQGDCTENNSLVGDRNVAGTIRKQMGMSMVCFNKRLFLNPETIPSMRNRKVPVQFNEINAHDKSIFQDSGVGLDSVGRNNLFSTFHLTEML